MFGRPWQQADDQKRPTWRCASLIVASLALAQAVTSTSLAFDCSGDCNGDDSVSLSELVLGVHIGLAQAASNACPAYTVDPDVTIEDLVAAVNRHQQGCPSPTPSITALASATPSTTASETPSATPSATPSESPTASPTRTPTLAWHFTDVTSAAGLAFEHRYVLFTTLVAEKAMFMGGVAAGDYDGDGWVDLYVLSGTRAANRLMRNRGDASFEDVAMDAGLAISGQRGAGPLFADYDGDGWLDLFLGGVEGTKPQLFRSRGDGTFENVTEAAGLVGGDDTFSAAFGDYDRDGDLDLIVTRWGVFGSGKITVEHLWRNNGDATFSGATLAAGLADLGVFLAGDENNLFSYTFTPNFADIDNDGWPDLLVAADFGSSRVFVNQRDGSFRNTTTGVISDQNGMGAAVGDYDNDGDLDWFVSSIYDPNGVAEGNWGVSGNRLYQNQGNGTFVDATTEAGVRDGLWGWGSCFADFNNDGFLDLFHVNGMGYVDDEPMGFFVQGAEEFHFDPARLFVSNGDGTFTEQAVLRGIADTGQGRGIVCFDYDRDGDVDVFIANNGQSVRLYRNDGGNRGNWLTVKLRGRTPNREAIGARVYAVSGTQTQMREIRAGSNFESQDPALAHFGLASTAQVDEVRVVWPDQTSQRCAQLSANQYLVVDQEAGECQPWRNLRCASAPCAGASLKAAR